MGNERQTQLSSMFMGEPYVDYASEISLERVKTLLGIPDDDELQDKALKIIIGNVVKHLYLKLKRVDKSIKGVPSELDFVIEEISIRRYNRIGSEGFQSDSVEGHSITFYELEKDFTPYEEIIDDYKDDDFSGGRGKVILI